MNYWWQLSILAICSYFVSNFNAAVFISNHFIHKDIREYGSKNPGTTNMARVFGLRVGVATFVVDFLKGFACALAGRLIFGAIAGAEPGMFAGYLAGSFVLLGHIYPVLYRFKGGKGFASGIGIFIAMNPAFTLPLMLVGVFVLALIDRMSVCALLFFAIQAAYHFIAYPDLYMGLPIFTLIYFILVVISHRQNIVRLIHGEEKRLGIREKFIKKQR